MSSNGFLNAPEMGISFAMGPRWHPWRQPLLSLGVNSAGDWRCRTLQGFQPVLLLLNKSVWLTKVAGLTVKTDDGQAMVLWFLRHECDPVAWRRLRVWAFHSQE